MKTERALVGTDCRGSPIVLATDSGEIACSCEQVSSGAEDIGLVDDKDCPTPGLYLWEGTSRLETNRGAPWEPAEPEVVFTGTLRPVRPEEVAALYALTPPEEPEVPDAAPGTTDHLT
jgi:hypothetical protein